MHLVAVISRHRWHYRVRTRLRALSLFLRFLPLSSLCFIMEREFSQKHNLFLERNSLSFSYTHNGDDTLKFMFRFIHLDNKFINNWIKSLINPDLGKKCWSELIASCSSYFEFPFSFLIISYSVFDTPHYTFSINLPPSAVYNWKFFFVKTMFLFTLMNGQFSFACRS